MYKLTTFLFILIFSGIALQSAAQGEKSFKDGVKKYYEHDFPVAIQLLTVAIDSNPKFLRAYNARALAYRSMKDYDKALSDYNKIILLSPSDTLVYTERGITYGFLKKFDLAIQDYSKRIELDPKNPKSFLTRGNAFLQEKKYDLAIKDFESAIQLNPRMAISYRFKGLAECLSGDTLAGCNDFNKVKELGFAAIQKLIDQYCGKKKD